jgi:hypothetical protein
MFLGRLMGFDSFWAMDHFPQIPMIERPDQRMLEGWTIISTKLMAMKFISLMYQFNNSQRTE